MANKDDHLTYYREFFENFAQTVNPNDQLPVKLASYKLINLEVVGGVIDWTTQYLTQKKCPQNLIAPLVQIVIDETRKSCKKQPTACGFNPSDNAYEPLKLMQTVMAKTNEICARYLDNSMLCSLPSPGLPHNVVSVCAAKNKRRRMEDRHVVIHDLNTIFNIQEASPSSYYAIFDGHAGYDAAAYSAAHLHQFLAENKQFHANPEQALLDAFAKTDALFIDKCNVEERISGGTTAVCALLRPKEKTLYIAWVGDSQALLVNQGRVLQCVNPHKPCRTDEKERIEKQGGFVCYFGTWRVNGQLAVSRAIGDAEYKPYVIAVPDIREIPLDGGEDFLILACDGLWDFLSEDDAARTVYEMVCSNPDKTDQISERLVYLSKEQGSADNISVIVVFLREPSKIAAEAHWANRNAMDTSLDNANNPFVNSNGADNNIIPQKNDGLLLNLAENFKHNGSDLSPSGDFYHNTEKSNGKRPAEFDEDDDLGPETDVDAVDDALSPSIAAAKALAEGIVNNNPGSFNPFVEKHEVEKAALEIDLDLQKQQSSEFDGRSSPREEPPTPPADSVHDGGLVDNAAESGEESEDEWNYITGEEANKENINPTQSDREVANILEDQDSMSQLNPNAAEFVPVSPTRSIASPVCRALINDPVLAQSPKRPTEIDINLPSPQEFEKEVKSKPSDVDTFSNGHGDENEQKSPSQELMENLLNGKNIDEIPEFTPTKPPTSEEFHFGPNAAPFSLAKSLDQSETAISTKAVFGDETILDASLDASQDNVDFTTSNNKEEDPMSMSFYQDKSGGDVDPFDLNQVQQIPDNLDDFLNKPEVLLNNDERIQTTDLDKVVDDEKELASPASNDDDDDSSGVCELSKSPQPQTEELIEQLEFIAPKLTLPDVCLRPEAASPQSEADDLLTTESVSPACPISPEPEVVEDFVALSPEPQPVLTPEPQPVLTPEQPQPLEAALLQPEELPTQPQQYSDLLSEFNEPQAVLSPEPQEPTLLTPEPQQLAPSVESPTPSSFEPQLTASFEPPITSSFEPQLAASFEPLAASFEPQLTSSFEAQTFSSEPQLASSFEQLQPASPFEAQLAHQPEQYSTQILSPVPSAVFCEIIEPPQEVGDVYKTETEELVESPVDDITSSVKDPASPVSSPLPADQAILNYAQELNDAVQASVPIESSSPIREQQSIPDLCPISTPKSVTDTESVVTTDLNSFLDRSNITELASPLSPVHPDCGEVAQTCTEIKTENIAPEFPEPAVITPTTPSAPSLLEETVKEPTAAVALGVAGAGAVVAAGLAEKKTAKPKTPIAKKGLALKSPGRATPSPAKPKTPLAAKPKTSTTLKPTTATSKTSTGAVPRTAATTKAAPKPKTSTSTAVKPTEKKPLTNGDLKPPPIRSSLSIRKSLDSPKSPATKPATTTATKPPASRVAAPRPTTAPTRTATKPTTTTAAPPKPRPTTLLNRTSVGVTKTSSATTTTKLTATKTTSPTKPRPITAPATKPRVPLTRTITKPSADTEKQIKDSANKLTASRTVTSSRSTGIASARSVTGTATTVRRIEAKTTGATRTTLTKTTTTSTRLGVGKKPLEITRTKIKSTTKSGGNEKPIQNGVSSVVVEEEITVVNNTVNASDSPLMKDNSPIDNKLIVDANAAD